ncbi:MAG: hypothetical protein KDA89_17530 [Planctomycetaceae bacterium]|nr:hypothetical protein [Planctomycetaceae bacterium]
MVTPDADLQDGQRPFIAHAGLDLVGPVTAILTVRSAFGGQGASRIARRGPQAEFDARQTEVFEWPFGKEWKTVQAELPDKSGIVHLRIIPPADARGIQIQSILLRDSRGRLTSFRF